MRYQSVPQCRPFSEPSWLGALQPQLQRDRKRKNRLVVHETSAFDVAGLQLRVVILVIFVLFLVVARCGWTVVVLVVFALRLFVGAFFGRYDATALIVVVVVVGIGLVRVVVVGPNDDLDLVLVDAKITCLAANAPALKVGRLHHRQLLLYFNTIPRTLQRLESLMMPTSYCST